jgi:hypothetical protein
VSSSWWVSVLATIAACAAATAAIWGLRYAKGLLDTAVKDRRVDRVLALHHEITTGEIAAARNRFNELMYRAGEDAFGLGKCWRPDWDSLVPPNPAVSKELNKRRFLSTYPAFMVSGTGHTPIHDLRLVLWSFDRVNEARKREASLDEDLLVSLMGYSVVWWSLMCGRLEPKRGGHVKSLLDLASWMQQKNWTGRPEE